MLDKPLKKIVFIIYFLKFLILFGQTPAIDFGDQGIFIYSQDSALHEIRDLVTTADGSIFCLLAERKFIEGASKSENNITLLKLNLLGELDPTFATSGVFRNDFPGFIDSYPFDLTITSEEILITGIGINSETSSETVTLKLNNTGMIDYSYGANGSLTYQVTPSVDARAYLLNSNEDTYLYGSAYFELRDETNEFPYVKKHTGGLLDEDFGTNGGQFYDLIFPSNHALPTARVAHVEGGKVFGAIEENNRLLLYGFNHFADGYKSAHVFAVNKETGLLDDTYKANGVNHVKREVEYNCELKNIVSYKDEHWAGIHNENGIDSDYELYNLNTDNSYTIDFQNKRDELNVSLSKNQG